MPPAARGKEFSALPANSHSRCVVAAHAGSASTQMLPVIDKSQSDSGSYDNVLEFLYHGSDRSLPECMLMMIPEPWQVKSLW